MWTSKAYIAVAALLSSCGIVQAAGRTGTTNMTFSSAHGTQIEYLAADGRTFLWYPGNRIVVRGAWRQAPYVTGAAGGLGICFRYGSDTYNPATGTLGGRWECEPLGAYHAGLVQTAPGDIFGLSRTTTAPFDLPYERTTLQAVRAHLQ